MITLYQFPAAFAVPNISPYCLKLETFLRLTGQRYQVKNLSDPSKGPKGKLPFIELEGEVIGDSAIVLQHLSKRFKLDLDSHLDAAGLARGVAITRLCDEHLVHILVYFRWVDAKGWAQIRPALFGRLAAPLSWFVPGMVQRKVRSSLYSQGIGRHSRDELLAFAREDLQALHDLLGSADYFGGAQPCSADAAAYGVLANLIFCTLETPLNRMAREFPSLVAYCERLRAAYWA
ncbi:hypothetical protein A9179_16835 [Pseudomonas alcaligenes]|uniref:Glutathione S-transferase n=1 Tax=Aquipseudomonas alcaligenes TaxID=43263 RepID=A0ABR7S4T0_AQUAC|nr:glutathione S-transferase family protein [Pseudomonas alcaligenes]MBC9251939.1 hypothetical protein [Pseudomonas alcaligenes]